MNSIGGVSGIGAPLPPNRIGGDNFIRYIGDRLILDFHEGAGRTPHDLSGGGRIYPFGPASAAPTWERGRLSFDGGDYVFGGSSLSLDKITIEAQIKWDTVSTAQYTTGEDDGTNRNWAFYLLSTGKLRLLIFISNATKSKDESGTRIVNTWYHTLATADGTNLKLFIDGVDDGTPTSYTGNIDKDTVNSYIGAKYATQLNLQGDISFIRINATAFSAPQVLQEYLWNKWRS